MPKPTTRKRTKQNSKIYQVVNTMNQPGRVIAIFANEKDANKFADTYEAHEEGCEVEERTLHYGQPDIIGYNP